MSKILSKHNTDDLIEIATKMAQELQDFVDEATEAAGIDRPEPGSQMSGTQSLIDEWEEIFSKTDLGSCS